jgi:hypothetical protein
MPCSPDILRQVPLFALLDDEETAVLAAQVEVKNLSPRQRIYKIGDPANAPTSSSPARSASPPLTKTIRK